MESDYECETNTNFLNKWMLVSAIVKYPEAKIFAINENGNSASCSYTLDRIPRFTEEDIPIKIARSLEFGDPSPTIVDEVRVYSRKLTEEEIKRIFYPICSSSLQPIF